MICPNCGKSLKTNLKIEVCSKCPYEYAACIGCLALKPPPPCPDCGSSFQVKIILWVKVPETVTAVYIAGNFNNWNPGKTRLKYDPDINVWWTTLISSEEGIIEYKYTQGTWETVETTNNLVDIPNRRIEVKLGSGFSDYLEIRDRVEEWKMDKNVSDLVVNLKSPDKKVRINTLSLFRSNSIRSKSAKHALPFIYGMLFDSEENVRVEAADVINVLKPSEDGLPYLIRSLLENSAEVNSYVRSSFVFAGRSAIQPLIQLSKYEDKIVRENAIYALGLFKENVNDIFRRLLEAAVFDAESSVRSYALESLGRLYSWPEFVTNDDVPILIQMLKMFPENEAIMCRVVSALGRTGPPLVIDPLLQLIHNYPQKSFSLIAVSVLGKTRLPVTIDPILQLMYNHYPKYRDREVFQTALYDLVHNSSLNHLIVQLAVRAASYEIIITREHGGTSHISLEESESAVRALCNTESNLTSNLLHLICKAKNITVKLFSNSCSEEGPPTYDSLTSFEHQRNMALDELRQRGNPPYNPDVYLGKG